MEHRGRQHHRERLGEAMREEIAELIEGELNDPRIGLATVSELHLSPDGRAARVLVSVSGDQAEQERTLAGLDAARPFIRRQLAQRLHLRHAPDLYFELDRSQLYQTRIDELLQRLHKRSKQG